MCDESSDDSLGGGRNCFRTVAVVGVELLGLLLVYA
jgi:hypothetical protein